MKKEDFLQDLISMSREDINKIIKDKGKRPKLIRIMRFTGDINKKNGKC